MNLFLEEQLAHLRQREILCKALQRQRLRAVMRGRRALRPRVRHALMVGLTVLALLLVTLALASPAAAHLAVAAHSFGGTGADSGEDLVVDAAGNRYLTGSFQGRATFGSGAGAVTLTSRGQDDAFVARVDAAGALVWVRQIGGSLSDQGRGIALLPDGSLAVVGHFRTTIDFVGSDTRLSSRGQSDTFLARYSRDGQLLWALRAGGTGVDNGLRIAADGAGNVIVTGNFAGQATFADSASPAAATLTSAGSGDVFLVKYDSTGRLLWARRAGGTGNDSGRDVAVAHSGAIFLAGLFRATASFPSPGGRAALSSAGSDDLFVARYSPDGDLRWAVRGGGAASDRALAITVDTQERSYVTGFFTDAATLGGIDLTGEGKEIYLAELSPDGVVLQAVSAGGAGVDEAHGIARDAQGTLYLTGTYEDTAFFGSGARLRELRQRSRGESGPNSSILVAAFDASLQPTFVEGVGREALPGVQVGNAIVVDSGGRVHVTGHAHDGQLGVGTGILDLGGHGEGDVLLATYETGATGEVFYLSSSSGGTIDGIGFADADVLAYDPANNRWSVLIDGSDIGLANTDIDAFEWVDAETLLMSFDTPIVLPGIAGTVDDSDIVRFIPSQLGATTSGRFELFFDGSDVGLTSNDEDIDAIGIITVNLQPEAVGATNLPGGGQLMISTLGPASVPGDAGELRAEHEDLLVFNATSMGENASGSWELFYDGSSDALGDETPAGIAALWLLPDARQFVFGPGAPVKMSGMQSGDGADLVQCQLVALDGFDVCAPRIFFPSSAAGFVGEVVDAFSVGDSGVLGDIGDGDDTEAGPPEDPNDAPNQDSSLFLPLIRR
ncbi:MAG: hypothetical protein OHK0015_28010 [Chloroflexi bacterium OHK40]